MSNQKITIAIAGSTERTLMCADALAADPRFEVLWTLSPAPKVLGRKKILTNNPLHQWSLDHSIKPILLDKKIDQTVKDSILAGEKIDFLLVVDFGYLVPTWLLELPKKAPLNVHPSLLPRWRGSSPGQFVLLYGEKKSGVTLMVMNEGLDSGPVIAQLPFNVEKDWTQTEYYAHSFELIKEHIADLISDFAKGSVQSNPQPLDSPTPVARRLVRGDGFIAWGLISHLLEGSNADRFMLNIILAEARSAHAGLAQLMAAACKALSPWPGLWTLVETDKGELRLKILSCHVEDHKLLLDEVQLEGKQPTSWSQVKSQLS